MNLLVSIVMPGSYQLISNIAELFQPVVLSVKRVFEVVVPFEQGLHVINGTLEGHHEFGLIVKMC